MIKTAPPRDTRDRGQTLRFASTPSAMTSGTMFVTSSKRETIEFVTARQSVATNGTSCAGRRKQRYAPLIAAFVLAHGEMTESVWTNALTNFDMRLTRKLVRVGDLLGIPILDHLIVWRRQWCSFVELGLLPMPSAIDLAFASEDDKTTAAHS